jgi:hypothetical protein
MDDSLLGKLPGELRNRIYEIAILQPDGVMRLNLSDDIPKSDYDYPEDMAIAQTTLRLASTCQAIRSEVLSLFYASHHFTFNLSSFDSKRKFFIERADSLKNDVRRLCGRLASIGTAHLASLKPVKVDLANSKIFTPDQRYVVSYMIRTVLQELDNIHREIGAQFVMRIKLHWSRMPLPSEERGQRTLDLALPVPWDGKLSQTFSQQVDTLRERCITTERFPYKRTSLKTLAIFEQGMRAELAKLRGGNLT